MTVRDSHKKVLKRAGVFVRRAFQSAARVVQGAKSEVLWTGSRSNVQIAFSATVFFKKYIRCEYGRYNYIILPQK